MKTPDIDSIDFVPVSILDAGKTESPASHTARIESLGSQYAVSQEQVVLKQEEVTRIETLKDSFNTQSYSPDIPTAKTQPKNVEQVNKSDEAYSELVKQYPDIEGATLGQARQAIENSNNKYEFKDVETFSLPLLAGGLGVIAANASAVPAFVAALAAGPTGVVTTTGLAVAGVFGVVPIVVATGFLAYGGYKLFKNMQGKLRINRDQKKLETAWSVV